MIHFRLALRFRSNGSAAPISGAITVGAPNKHRKLPRVKMIIDLLYLLQIFSITGKIL